MHSEVFVRIREQAMYGVDDDCILNELRKACLQNKCVIIVSVIILVCVKCTERDLVCTIARLAIALLCDDGGSHAHRADCCAGKDSELPPNPVSCKLRKLNTCY
jgi:hypothetical protein